MTDATPNSTVPAPAAAPAAGTPPAATPASPNPSLLGAAPAPTAAAPAAVDMPASFEGGAVAWAALDDAGKGNAIEAVKTASTARTEAFTKAEGVDAKKAAYEALTKDEKIAAFKAMDGEVKKSLGVEDPAVPVYTEFKLPEGVTIDDAGMKPAVDLFKKSGLSQEQAQQFIDLATSREMAAAQKGQQAYVDLQNTWVSEIKADPEIGGDKLTASIAASDALIDRLAIPGLKEALNLTGAGNHPAIAKAFVRLGKMIQEDRFQAGNAAVPAASRSPAEVIYGADPSKPSP